MEKSTANLLDQRQNMNLLFDFYGVLITDKQRQIFTMYVVEDHSFSEIAVEFGITPQAVSDFLKRARQQLEKYENSLGLVAKFLNQQNIINDIFSELDKYDETQKIRELLGELTL